MIYYNFKYRGPFEYEKFILNIFQFHNQVVLFQNQLIDDQSTNGILNKKEELDNMFNECIEDKFSEKVHRLLLKIK